MVGIYKITNPSGKVYIGQSWAIENRWVQHKCEAKKKGLNIPLHNSIRKYGFESHKLEIVWGATADVTQSKLDLLEIRAIRDYADRGIELLNVKEGGRGGKHSKSSREKMRESHKGVSQTPESNIKRSLSLKGRPSPMKGKIMSPETKEKIREFMRTRIQTEEHRKKNSETKSGKNNPMFGVAPWNKNIKGLQKAWNKGKTFSNTPRAIKRREKA